MPTANPAFSERAFAAPSYEVVGARAMTVNGTAEKGLLLLLLVIVPAIVTWKMVMAAVATGAPAGPLGALIGVGLFGGFILAMITCFKQRWAPVTAPLYCIAEGLFLGAISAGMELVYKGIAFQAMMLTFGVFVSMLMLYRAGVLRATPAFTRGVIGATLAIALVYLVDIVLNLFHMNVPFIHSTGWLGIGISLVIVTIAALNLILDFGYIEKGAAQGFPKYMEWYGAFGLMVTLIWLYIEILRLLAKLRER